MALGSSLRLLAARALGHVATLQSLALIRNNGRNDTRRDVGVLYSDSSVLCHQIQYLPEEPFIEELEGGDVMEFPPPPEPPLEDEAVIPPRVIDQLLDAPDHEILASLNEVCAVPRIEPASLCLT